MRRGLALLASAALLGVVLVSVAGGATGASQPRVAGVTLEGKRIALADLRGKPVVINVWSSW